MSTTVAVVGAGMSGLIAARSLHRRGIDVLVLESADRPGGRMMAETSPLGSRVDLGGQWVGHGHHRFTALADELGTTLFAMRTPKLPDIVQGSRRVPVLGPTMLTTGAVLLMWELRSRLGAPGRWDAQTVEARLGKVPGRQARRLLEVLVEVSTTADLDRYSMRDFAGMVRFQGGLTAMMSTKGGAQEGLIAEGAGTLPERLAAELGPRVLTGRRVTSIQRGEDGVTLRTAAGAVRTAKVIVSVPPPMSARISHDPPLPADRTALEQGTYMGSVYKAIAVYERPFWRDQREHAEFMLLDDPGVAVFDTTPPDGPGHLCFLVAGAEARALDGREPADRRQALLGPLVPHLGTGVLQPVSWHEKSWHLDEHVGGGYAALPLPGSGNGRLPVPSGPVGDIHWAGTETASEHAGYIEGAIEAGERAAREVIESLPSSAAAKREPSQDGTA
ncbi:flavin monoamine oxidase family protein [Actinomadura hibisca]|uniref:flavin monoamine oxidase family protein n=1 Tax=Actinomadura hibisca TaxID=68565 RepID=UPI000829E0E8|nr:FAD-dependent oxidoreductase [Actinomadura hibisca]